MNLTIQEYANQRGVTKQAVYNAIRRAEIETITGVSNGKQAQFLNDEAQEYLDQVMRPTAKSNELAVASINLAIAERETTLLREKEKEMTETRNQLISKVNGMAHGLDLRLLELTDELTKEREELRASYSRELNQMKQELMKANEKIQELDQMLAAANATIKEQEKRLNSYVAAPFQAYKELRRLNKNGKSTESN